jgi:hypothetical protein
VDSKEGPLPMETLLPHGFGPSDIEAITGEI